MIVPATAAAIENNQFSLEDQLTPVQIYGMQPKFDVLRSPPTSKENRHDGDSKIPPLTQRKEVALINMHPQKCPCKIFA